MKRIKNTLFRKKPVKVFEAIQVEVSSACNLKCKFCPTTYLKKPRGKHLLSLEELKRLEPYFKLTKWVYLQGWGEPLLNTKIWEMVEIIKKTGAKVGFTTNGTYLNQEVVSKIIDTGVDLLSVSIAGSTPKTHNALRFDSKLDEIITGLELLLSAKKASVKRKPLVTLSYMLTKESIQELPRGVKLAHGLGVDDMYTTNLDYVFNEDTNQSKVFSWEGKGLAKYRRIIDSAKNLASEQNLSFRTYPLEPEEEKPVCDLNPNEMVFITSDGHVTPCTYLGRFQNPRYFKDEKLVLPLKSFGNINKEDFWKIWNSQPYQAFKKPFTERSRAYERLLTTMLNHEPSLIRIKEAEKQYYQSLKNNPVPAECKTCPKMYGI
jgi:MoaA/NifB/PqqE/SkfB family radical SAM enzyme